MQTFQHGQPCCCPQIAEWLHTFTVPCRHGKYRHIYSTDSAADCIISLLVICTSIWKHNARHQMLQYWQVRSAWFRENLGYPQLWGKLTFFPDAKCSSCNIDCHVLHQCCFWRRGFRIWHRAIGLLLQVQVLELMRVCTLELLTWTRSIRQGRNVLFEIQVLGMYFFARDCVCVCMCVRACVCVCVF